MGDLGGREVIGEDSCWIRMFLLDTNVRTTFAVSASEKQKIYYCALL